MLGLISCRKADIPKPYGYYRIALPDQTYSIWSEKGVPYSFALNDAARVVHRNDDNEQYWIDVEYPSLNASIHCSYKPVQGNLGKLSDDAYHFVMNHAVMASAIPEHEYMNDEARTYGLLFDLQGNTASAVQFYLTDSIHHFFRGAVYTNCVPNQDSLAPVIEFMRGEAVTLMETLRWQ